LTVSAFRQVIESPTLTVVELGVKPWRVIWTVFVSAPAEPATTSIATSAARSRSIFFMELPPSGSVRITPLRHLRLPACDRLRPAVRGEQPDPGLVDGQEDPDDRPPARQIGGRLEEPSVLLPERQIRHRHPLPEGREPLQGHVLVPERHGG